ncbi:MAG: succinate dehydrogenase, cytochrome b556 subunit [Pseudomonadota bacterium]
MSDVSPPARTEKGKPASTHRPVSPHLQVYRPQLTSVLSIFHRFTGMILSAALFIFALWLVILSLGPDVYLMSFAWLTSPVGIGILFIISLAAFYHLCTGIRHLIWDMGWALSLEAVYTSGWLALIAAGVLTAGYWLWILS